MGACSTRSASCDRAAPVRSFFADAEPRVRASMHRSILCYVSRYVLTEIVVLIGNPAAGR